MARCYQYCKFMPKQYHVKGRPVHRFHTNALAIDHPQAFSMQLKPQSLSQSRYNSPTSHSRSQNIVQKNICPQSEIMKQQKRSRVTSANATSVSVRVLSGKAWSHLVTDNSHQRVKSSKKQTIKWIGVHPQPKNNTQILSSQAFPKRQHRLAEQSFSNFMLRYGKFLKTPKTNQPQNILNGLKAKMYQNIVQNAATVKVKPRLTWFGKKKPECEPKTISFNSDPDLEVVWLRNNI